MGNCPTNFIGSPDLADNGQAGRSNHTGCPPSFPTTSRTGAAAARKLIASLGHNHA
ncbi:hypothetical protein ACFQ07_02945 [Actinomadura adrarensis]|uniref:Uncharacterized protein n=1 Tax=Actinomadura adrarensis TaxID=1819600 RepID=A0ABW3C9K7_9ACTN